MDRNLIERQLGHIDRELLYDLNTELSGQLDRPENERDEKLIAELWCSVEELQNDMIERSRRRSLDNVLRMAEGYKKSGHVRIKRLLAAAAAFAAVFVLLNAASMKVISMNKISSDHTLSKGGITISTDNLRNEPMISISPEDPYRNKKLCAKYCVELPAPLYLPEGIEFGGRTVYYHDENGDIPAFIYTADPEKFTVDQNDPYILKIWFNYRKDDGYIGFGAQKYPDSDDVPPLEIPTESFDVREKKINGKTVFILKEGDTFNAYFVNGNVLCRLYTCKIDIKESEKILDSMIYQR